MLVVFILVVLLFQDCQSASCQYSSGGHTIDLSPLADYQILYTSGNFAYQIKMCSSSLSCSGQSALAIQENPSNQACNTLASWDSSVSGTYSSSSKSWTMNFVGGSSTQCSGGESRSLTTIFTCDEDALPYSSSDQSLANPASCEYEWTIPTAYACVSGSGSSSDSGEISAGSIMLIIILLIVILYCILGYIWNARKEGNWKDVKSNAPHTTFWFLLLPKYTWAGCKVSKDWTMGKINKIRGKDNDGYNETDDEEIGM